MRGLVMACGHCLYDDAARAKALFEPDVIVAVNHAGLYFDRVDHWASCHIDLFPGWLLERAAKDLPAAGQLWVNETKLPNLTPAQKAMGFKGAPYWDGTSGELGIQVALKVGCDKVVVAGMPMTNGPHFYEGLDFTFEKVYRRQLGFNLHKFGDKVRSMSGWTMEQLGEPNQEWLECSSTS